MRARRLILPGLLTLAALILLVSLGNWQLRRLAWKENLIASATERPKLPPLDWSDPAQRKLADDPMFLGDYNYRRIRLDGEYLPEKEARVFTSLPAEDAKGPASGPGALIMTPFEAKDAGAPIWINRGFVPEGSTWAPPPAGEIEILGLIRPDDPPGWFTPKNGPEMNLFFSRSIEALSAAKQLPESGPAGAFTIDLLPAPGAPALPQAGETPIRFPNNHLQYAITWYGLAAALLAVFAAFAWRTFRPSDEKAA